MVNYLVIYEHEDEEPIEVPIEEDNSVLFSTITGLFPSCTGLKYKADTGLLRCLKLSDNKVLPPEDGWNNKKVLCIFPKESKRKFVQEGDTEATDEVSNKLKRLEGKKCTDLIVLNLPWRTNEDDLRRYFGSFGELVTVQIKRDPVTQNSKGYGFIRFATYESQLLCLAEKHFIDGRWCDVKIPMSKSEGDKQEVSRKIHVGRISENITVEQLRTAFERYGRVIDVFVPKPFRSFAFVTFNDPDVAANLLGKEVEIEPGCVSLIGSAVPKLPPTNSANQKQMAVAMHAAACVAAMSHGPSFNWGGPGDYKPGDDMGHHPRPRYHHPSHGPPHPPGHHMGPSGSNNSGYYFMPDSTTAAAAMLAAQYTRAHRQHQKGPPHHGHGHGH